VSAPEMKELLKREERAISIDTEGLMPSRKDVKKIATARHPSDWRKRGALASKLPRWRPTRPRATTKSTAKQALIVDETELQSLGSR